MRRLDLLVWRAALRRTGAAAMFATGALVLACPSVLAQPSEPRSGARELLRPLYATPQDIGNGRQVAQRFCVDCHGADGISTLPGVPHLAGQRAGYLFSEMRAYASGARGPDVMKSTLTYLSADAMSDVAAYYGSAAPAAPAAPGKTGEIDPVQAGKAASATCGACHGATGTSMMPGIPSLSGQEPGYLAASLGQYATGARKHDIMKAAAAPVSTVAAGQIALFYALQTPVRAPGPAAGNAAAGKALATACAACHGAQGVSGNASSPSLAGQDAQYLALAMRAYKDGTRSDATMKGIVAALDDTTMKNLAAFYAGLAPQRPNVAKPLTGAEWAARCNRCHGVDGNSTDPLIPALAAQPAAYLEKALDAYRTGKRRSAVMSAMTDGLSQGDAHNLAEFYAARPARAVVYVPIPPR